MEDAFTAIKAAGFEVYAPFANGRAPTYAFFTDGTNIGYIQRGEYNCGYRLSTVHKANRVTGTGFSMTDVDACLLASELTVDTLREAFRHAPAWASEAMRCSVNKFADWNAFKTQYWDRALERVTA